MLTIAGRFYVDNVEISCQAKFVTGVNYVEG